MTTMVGGQLHERGEAGAHGGWSSIGKRPHTFLQIFIPANIEFLIEFRFYQQQDPIFNVTRIKGRAPSFTKQQQFLGANSIFAAQAILVVRQRIKVYFEHLLPKKKRERLFFAWLPVLHRQLERQVAWNRRPFKCIS